MKILTITATLFMLIQQPTCTPEVWNPEPPNFTPAPPAPPSAPPPALTCQDSIPGDNAEMIIANGVGKQVGNAWIEVYSNKKNKTEAKYFTGSALSKNRPDAMMVKVYDTCSLKLSYFDFIKK